MKAIKRVMMMVAALIAVSTMPAMAQQKVADKEIVGVWYMESFSFEGESNVYNCKDTKYTNVKVYRKDGEYACAILSMNKNGKAQITPHEYGTYSLKNGMYSEMGRSAIPYTWVDKNTSKGKYKNRHDIWKKIENCPKELEQYFIDVCKGVPTPIEQLINEKIFK